MRFRLQFAWTLTAILIAALVVRLAAGLWWQQRLPAGVKFEFGDSEGYWELARTIARGEPYEYGPDRLKIFRTPGYPLVLAPLFLIRDEPPVIWGRVISAVLGTAAVAGVAGLARLLFDQRAALIAAAVAAIYPESVALGVFILSEAAFTPLMLLHLIGWALAWRASSRQTLVGWSLTGGVAAGLATLARPSWILFLPFAATVGLVAIRDRQKQAAIAALMAVGLCLAMLPWWIRNYRVAGRCVPTSLQIGASLYDGLSPAATGASNMEFVGQFVAEQRAADAAEPDTNRRGLFEDRLDRRMRSAATAWAGQHPAGVIQLAAIKFVRMWNLVPNASEFRSLGLRLVLAVTYTPIAILALVGAWRYARRDWPLMLCLLPTVYFTCLHMIFVSSIRYRQPAMLPLIVLAAAVVAVGWDKRASRAPAHQ